MAAVVTGLLGAVRCLTGQPLPLLAHPGVIATATVTLGVLCGLCDRAAMHARVAVVEQHANNTIGNTTWQT